MFRENDFRIVDKPPEDEHIRLVRAWDFAASEKATADRTAGVLVAQSGQGSERHWTILDVASGRWSPAVTRKTLKATAEADGPTVTQLFEQEPGGSGKILCQELITAIAPLPGDTVTPTGSKVVRATGFAAQVEAGNVSLLRGPWNRKFLDELKTFPVGRRKDQTDASVHGFNWLASHEPDYSWADLESALS